MRNPFKEAQTLYLAGHVWLAMGEKGEAVTTLERALTIFTRLGARLYIEAAVGDIQEAHDGG
jgi:RES domain-containing protein